MSRRRWLAVALLAAAGCAAPPARSGAQAPSAERLPVRVDFVPPLPWPGALWFACEAGAAGSVSAPCSGVDLSLPPGPATLTLKADGTVRELVVVVTRGMAPVRWQLGASPPRGSAAGNGARGVAGRPARR
jgi:hypothetical protein